MGFSRIGGLKIIGTGCGTRPQTACLIHITSAVIVGFTDPP
jgi:hypothetical protein